MEERKMEKVRNFFKDESGASMPEYALLVALIAVVGIAATTLLGGNVRDKLDECANGISGAS
jgi:pilus assembly protein Flp/PilA